MAGKKQKPQAKTTKASPVRAPRRLKTPRYRSFRLHKRIKHPQSTLPGAIKLFSRALKLLWAHKRLFAGIVVVYGILNIILVRGFTTGLQLQELKDALSEIFQGNLGEFASGVSVFGFLLGSVGTTSSEGATVYQMFLVLITSLVLIWALRQVQARQKAPKAKEAFYHGTYPLVPFLLVLLVVGIQLIPLIVGSTLFGIAVGEGIAIATAERALWAILFFLLALLSIYMLCSSLFALYIVTLPDMTPLKALRSARQLVLHRRWRVIRRVLFLPFILVILSAVIMVPLILWLTVIAEWTFFVLAMAGLAVVHAYMYTLYRELL